MAHLTPETMGRKRKSFAIEKPKGSGNFYLTVYNPRRRPTRKYPPLKAKTREAAEREALRLLDRHSLPPDHPDHYDPWAPPPKDEALSDAVALYLLAHSHQSPNTLANKRSTLEAFVSHTTAHSPADVRADDVEAHIEANCEGLAESTITVYLGTLASFFRWAADEGLRPGYVDNPALAYKRKRAARSTYRSRARARATESRPREALLPRELARINTEIAQEDSEFVGDKRDHLPAVYEIAACTGTRLRELASRRRRHVRIQMHEAPDGTRKPLGGALVVDTYRDTRGSFTTKTGESRTVPLVPRAALLLHAALERHPDDDPDAPLLLGPTGTALNATHTSGLFTHYRKEAGLPDAFTYHSLRHSFVTWLLTLGLLPDVVLDLAGHRDLKTQRRYTTMRADLTAGRAREVASEILAFFCPALPEDVTAREVSGVSDAAYGAGSSLFRGASPWRMQDVLFGAALYREQAEAERSTQSLRISP